MPRAARNNYELSQEPVDDISTALIYLENESPQAADRLQSILIEAFERLAKWPESGHRRSDLTDRPVRFVYRVANHTVQIVAVLHDSRDVQEILSQR